MILTKDKILNSFRQAAKISDQICVDILPFIKQGVTELEIEKNIIRLAKEQGCPHLSFKTLVASGVRSALPHGRPTKKKLQQGEFVFIDFGVKVNGYCSDITRTFIIGA
ncbi:MAG: M24 family metallopeptidase, partial [Candidatus Margulisiibacteriota bacterium]